MICRRVAVDGRSHLWQALNHLKVGWLWGKALRHFWCYFITSFHWYTFHRSSVLADNPNLLQFLSFLRDNNKALWWETSRDINLTHQRTVGQKWLEKPCRCSQLHLSRLTRFIYSPRNCWASWTVHWGVIAGLRSHDPFINSADKDLVTGEEFLPM